MNKPVDVQKNLKPASSFTDYFTPKVVFPVFIGTVLIFSWMMGIIG